MHPLIRTSSRRRMDAARAGFSLAFILAACPALAAGTFFVDANHPNCSPAGPGTVDNPYCTIGAAAAAQGGPGTTIIVSPGIYREQLTVSASGVAGSPFVIRASQPGVVIDGADLYSGTQRWTPYQGSVHLANDVSWVPSLVYVDDVRLASASGDPAAIPPQSFVYVAGSGLYVNLGGDNPGAHRTYVGRRGNGVRVSARTYVQIEGFQIYRAGDKGIHVLGGSSNIIVIGNQVTQSFTQGISLAASTNCRVSSNVVFENGDHGILLTGGVTGTLLEWNESFRNARFSVRAANGLNLAGSSGNTIIGNRWHHNQDTGAQYGSSSHDNLSLYNASWSNGDHGYDHLASTGAVHYGDIAWNNYKDGFSFEGNAPGGRMFNCISTDNGLTTNEYNLWVDAASSVGFMSNSNVLWNSTGQPPVKYVSAPSYATVAAYSAATGKDTRSRQADPRFVNPAAGDFHVQWGSSAIDLADATVPGWPSNDLAGHQRLDDPFMTDGGVGSPTFGDAGLYESIPADSPPTVIAPLTRGANEGTTFTIQVTASDFNGDPIDQMNADLSSLPQGNNAIFVANELGTAGTFTWTTTRADGRAAPYPVVFRASNALTGSATTSITVVDIPGRAPVMTAPSEVNAVKNSAVTVHVTASDPDGDAITSLTADLSKLGGNAAFVASSDKRSGTLTWTPTKKNKFDVTFTARNALTGTVKTRIDVRNSLTDENGGQVSSQQPDVTPDALPAVLELSNAVPNPGRADGVSFVLRLPQGTHVNWSVFDIQGRELFSESRLAPAGSLTLRFDPARHRDSPGVFFARVRAGEAVLVRRFLMTE